MDYFVNSFFPPPFSVYLEDSVNMVQDAFSREQISLVLKTQHSTPES